MRYLSYIALGTALLALVLRLKIGPAIHWGQSIGGSGWPTSAGWDRRSNKIIKVFDDGQADPRYTGP